MTEGLLDCVDASCGHGTEDVTDYRLSLTVFLVR
jgi:hypothetical protein